MTALITIVSLIIVLIIATPFILWSFINFSQRNIDLSFSKWKVIGISFLISWIILIIIFTIILVIII